LSRSRRKTSRPSCPSIGRASSSFGSAPKVATLIRSLLCEFGHVLPTGIEAVTAFANRHLQGDRPDMPELATGVLGTQCYHFLGLGERTCGYTKMIGEHALLSANTRRLMRMPGVGPITASAIVATIGEARQFGTGRDLAAWPGLTPLNKSSGGKDKLGRITKKGDRYIRKLLVVGMSSRALLGPRGTPNGSTSGPPVSSPKSRSVWQQRPWRTRRPGSSGRC
jgi:transposase